LTLTEAIADISAMDASPTDTGARGGRIALRCACGALTGTVAATHRAARAICYCRDCQTFARFLGQPTKILNERGGTDIVATTPSVVHFTQGREQLRCMSLSETGLLRWYAGCCRTPIGNTPRTPKLPYVGLVHNCLAGTAGELDAAFGVAKVAINTESASGPVSPTKWRSVAAVLKIMRNVVAARLSGAYRDSPFFKSGTAEPIVAPQVLSSAERAARRGG
jgi:hypothetical protein